MRNTQEIILSDSAGQSPEALAINPHREWRRRIDRVLSTLRDSPEEEKKKT